MPRKIHSTWKHVNRSAAISRVKMTTLYRFQKSTNTGNSQVNGSLLKYSIKTIRLIVAIVLRSVRVTARHT